MARGDRTSSRFSLSITRLLTQQALTQLLSPSPTKTVQFSSVVIQYPIMGNGGERSSRCDTVSDFAGTISTDIENTLCSVDVSSTGHPTPPSLHEAQQEVTKLRQRRNSLNTTFNRMISSPSLTSRQQNIMTPPRLWWINVCPRYLLVPVTLFSIFMSFYLWVYFTVEKESNSIIHQLRDFQCLILDSRGLLPKGAACEEDIDIYARPAHLSNYKVYKALFVSISVGMAAATSLLMFYNLLQRHRFFMMIEQFMPKRVIKQVMAGKDVRETFEDATILFCDICSFTQLSVLMSTEDIVDMLHELYSRFDDLVAKHGVYKTDIIGDAFMCMAGCPNREEFGAAARRIALLAFDMLEETQKIQLKGCSEPLMVKIGINTGPVMGCVIGHKVPHYSPFGDAVNMASRMQSHGQAGCIHISRSTASVLSRFSEFEVIKRDPSVDVKGKGVMDTFWLLRAPHTVTVSVG